jgi:cell division protein FtsW
MTRSPLDRADWVDDGRPRGRRASGAPAAAARPASGTRSRTSGASSAGAAGSAARGAASGSAPRRASAPSRPAARHRHAAHGLPGPGVAERRTLLLVTFLLLLYGLVMAYSASAAQAYFQYDSSFYFLKRQVLWALIGGVVMFVLSRVDYAWWRKAAVPLAGFVGLLLLAVLVPGIGSVVNGARRWIFVGGQGIQPSELAKLAAVVLVATLVVRRPGDVETPGGFARLVAVGIVPPAALIMLEPDMGTTLVLVVAVIAVLIAAGTRLRYLFALGVAGVLSLLALIAVEPYRMERLVTFLDPWKDPQGSGFQATQSLISIASGHLFGVGLGNSVQKFGFLPEQGTDMITGIIGEELGLAGVLVLLALFAALAWACFRIALSCRDLFGKLLATGITAIIIGQACINVGAALGLLPLTGVPLPLVSLGGTSLVVVFAGLGILLNVATNRRSYIVVSAERRRDAAGKTARRRRSPDADAERTERRRREPEPSAQTVRTRRIRSGRT